jgi:hypothetical protein
MYAGIGQKMSGWGAMKKEQINIRIFQVFGYFDGVKKANISKKAQFF